jgi:hypothetical protein
MSQDVFQTNVQRLQRRSKQQCFEKWKKKKKIGSSGSALDSAKHNTDIFVW